MKKESLVANNNDKKWHKLRDVRSKQVQKVNYIGSNINDDGIYDRNPKTFFEDWYSRWILHICKTGISVLLFHHTSAYM